MITTFNSENTIDRLLRSILNQDGNGSEFELEIIVVDDCSTDQTREIVQTYDVIMLSTGENSGGPNKGRNIGLRRVTGDYICLADHDDEWMPQKILAQLPHLERVPVVSSGYTVINTITNRTSDKVKNSGPEVIYFPAGQSFMSKLTKSNKGQNLYLGSIFYRSELKGILFEEHFGMVDFDWVLRLLYDRDSIEINRPLYYRYVAGSNLSLNEGYRAKDFYYSLLNIESYAAEFPKAVKIAYKKLHGSRARYFYLTGDMKKARFYFLRAPMNLKTIAYYFSTFWGSKYVKEKFNIFG